MKQVTSILYLIRFFMVQKLYEQIYSKPATIETNGLIEKDEVLINSEIVSILQRKFAKKIAIVTGRGKVCFFLFIKRLLRQF